MKDRRSAVKWVFRTVVSVLALMFLAAVLWHFFGPAPSVRTDTAPKETRETDGTATSGDSSREEITGTVIDVGEFSILIPKGWHAFPVTEDDAFLTDAVDLSVTAKSVSDLTESPYYRFSLLPLSALWDDSRFAAYAVDQPITVEAGDLVWEGYSVIGTGPAAVLWTRQSGRIFRLELFHEDPAVFTDPENAVLPEILSSVAIL